MRNEYLRIKSQLASYSDEQLLQLLSLDDKDAFSEIYGRYFSRMFSMSFDILRHRQGAEDAVQDVFVSLWQRRHRLLIASLGPYLFQCVRYNVIKAFREKKKSNDFYDRLAQVNREVLAEDPVLYHELQMTIRQLMNSHLSEEEHKIYSMSRDLQMTYKEIACAMKVSVKTVEKKLSRSLAKLRPGMKRMLSLVLYFTVTSL